ncbi:hypothetical protein ACFRGK_06365 [Bacillus subtilis]|uniref:hypothetical protein n=1 Tax=Bacillus TaxID=1386 RepID=UPI0013BCA1DA|nr:hypothetical protein [Bacillus subtilis]KAF2427344.1 hypothetical protein B6K89_03950 [Bacillus subtilis]MEC0312081.1 hypothetical protein [Bacillus subtilis]MEC0363704.1 hypothetical protein [Bacillus subtilis]
MQLRAKKQRIKVAASSNEIRKMMSKRNMRVPLGTEISKGRRVEAFCTDSNTLHEFNIKSFIIKENHILVNLC